MSLDKFIEHNKEHRKPYYGAKAIDATCRNHGSCEVCIRNRKCSNRKRQEIAEDKLREYEKMRVNLKISDVREHVSKFEFEE